MQNDTLMQLTPLGVENLLAFGRVDDTTHRILFRRAAMRLERLSVPGRMQRDAYVPADQVAFASDSIVITRAGMAVLVGVIRRTETRFSVILADTDGLTVETDGVESALDLTAQIMSAHQLFHAT